MPNYPSVTQANASGGQLSPIVTLPQGIATTGALNQNAAILNVFRVLAPISISQVSWGNGATINGNMDVGIYRKDSATLWTRLTSNGGAAQAGATVAQTLTFTGVQLVPGFDYAMAIASDSATATIYRSSSAAPSASVGICLNKATSYPLPATITSPTGATLWPTLWAA